MKIKIFIWVVSFFCTTISAFWYQELIQKSIDGKKVRVIHITLDDQHTLVSSLSQEGASLSQLMSQKGWVSAINGAYFCPKDYKICGGKNFTDRARIENNIYTSKWKNDLWASGLFAINDQNEAQILLHNEGYSPGISKNTNWKLLPEMVSGIANYPVLVLSWSNVLSQSEEILDAKIRSKWVKTFICTQNNKKDIYMGSVSDIDIYGMPDFLIQNFWCFHAVNLDSGASLWMIYNHEVMQSPGREIMDAWVVVELPQLNQKNKQKLLRYQKISQELLKKYPDKKTQLQEIFQKQQKKYSKNSQNYLLYEALQKYIKNNL